MTTKTKPLASEVSDAVVCAITREVHGHFTLEQKAAVRACLEAGLSLGYSLVWTDPLEVELERDERDQYRRDIAPAVAS